MKHYLAIVVAALVSIGASVSEATTPRDAKRVVAQWSHDGLERVAVAGLDLVYMRPGATLGAYRKVLLRPVNVAFRKDWEKQPRPGSRIRGRDQQQIKEELAAIIRDEAARELERGGYALVDGVAEDVLQVDLSIVDLYVNAPDLSSASRVDSYTVSAGEMTLQAELRDSTSGELLARALDRQVDPEDFQLRLTTRIDNELAARRIVQSWAQILRNQLDAARRARP